MISDKLLINLKILSKIQKNGRIARSYDGIIALENETMYQSLKRFLTSDSRKQAVFEINSIITECVDSLANITNSRFMAKEHSYTEEYLKGYENISLLLSEMNMARIGILNLKFTYQTDHNIASQLDIVILKMNTTIRDYTNKLIYYQSNLPGNFGDICNVELNSIRVVGEERHEEEDDNVIQMAPI